MTTAIRVDGNAFLEKHEAWTKGEASDASSAGTRREAIGAFAEESGLDTKAVSHVRAGLKIKNEGKRRDWLRSLQALLPIAEREVFDNEPSLPLDDEAQAQNERAAAAAAIQSDEMAEAHGAGGEAAPMDPELEQDTREFEDAVSNVEQVDFGGEAAE